MDNWMEFTEGDEVMVDNRYAIIEKIYENRGSYSIRFEDDDSVLEISETLLH